MKKIVFIILFVISLNSFKAQTTTIPDPNFEQALIDLGRDIGPINGSIPTANINWITNLQIGNKNISDLTGIQDFTSLQSLFCPNNQLTSLDLRANLSLTDLNCNNNQITTLNVDSNILIYQLECGNNQLTNISLINNLNLQFLVCSTNPITNLNLDINTSLIRVVCTNTSINKLNLSSNNLLEQVFCYNNSLLACLNIKNGNNSLINTLVATNNPILSCIEVDNSQYAMSHWPTGIDLTANYNTNCGNECSLVGIIENKLRNISFYPNPTSNNISIDLKEKPNAIITIYNISGKILFNKQYASNELIEINLDTPSGIYFVKVETDKGVFTEKILKQ